MATGTAGTNARRYHHCMVHYLRKAIAFSDGATATVTVGTVPAGACLLLGASNVTVTTLFNATGNALSIGTVAAPARFGSAMALGVATQVPCNVLTGAYAATDLVITATLALTGTTATTGQAIVQIAFTVDNDG